MRWTQTRFLFLIVFFIGLAFAYRFPNLSTPFWVDEFSAAEQARLFLRHGFGMFSLPNVFVEHHNITTYGLIALAFQLFGITTQAARLPSILVGSLIPAVVWLLARKIWDDWRPATIAALLTITSYFEITWSRQARGYMLQQLFLLLTLYLFLEFLSARQRKRIIVGIALAVTAILGTITHTTYLLVLIAMGTSLFFTQKETAKAIMRSPILWAIGGILFATLFLTNTLSPILVRLQMLFQYGLSNNVWYYHAFLWRVHTVVTLLAIIGWMAAMTKRRTQVLLFPLTIVAFLCFLSFAIAPYVSRYLLAIYPLLLIGVGFAITELTDAGVQRGIKKPSPHLFAIAPIAVALLLIANGNLFVTKPKAFYSVNHDMREIALVDYDQVFELIKRKGKLEEGKTAIIDTWPDRSRWYLGMEYQPLYAFRWISEPGLVNGLEKRSLFTIRDNGEKALTGFGEVTMIGELGDLERAMQKYPRGFLWIDDSSLPADVREYAEQRLTKELYLDHYPFDDNPYSRWPATLYSWGIEP